MNKKFFAALASATMAFTASGSIAVFADDFVEEKTPALGGNSDNLKPTVEKVVWNKENFGDLVTVVNQKDTFVGLPAGVTLKENEEVKTADLVKVTEINLQQYFEGEVKGLEYFPNLETFDDTAVASTTKVTNRALDFSANTKLTTLRVNNATGVAKVVLPEAYVDESKDETYKLTSLNLQNTKLTTLDLSKYDLLKNVNVSNNKTLKGITVVKGATLLKSHEYKYFNVSGNALEEIDLENCKFTEKLVLDDNRLGVIDLSKTTIDSKATFSAKDQKFYVSEDLAKIDLNDTFENIDTDDFNVTTSTNGVKYDEDTGVLELGDASEIQYTYTTKDNGKTKRELNVTVIAANPMNRLYNPNSGEHFYTADLNEKEALVKLGWSDEGFGWVAEKEGTGAPVYRLYNPNAGDHHYTTDVYEKDTLVACGWKDEGKGWYSPTTGDTVVVYRQYNPNANGAGSHNYTTDKAENDYLVSVGWVAEGTGWNGLR
ncbi:MAG: hypothetical protein Q4F14_02035 [Bacillota bacterium]|nr:hypothetical protein [Bacillota bacterium]